MSLRSTARGLVHASRANAAQHRDGTDTTMKAERAPTPTMSHKSVLSVTGPATAPTSRHTSAQCWSPARVTGCRLQGRQQEAVAADKGCVGWVWP